LADENLTPHTLRHSTAMRLCHADVDNAVIALWLGHHDIRSTQVARSVVAGHGGGSGAPCLESRSWQDGRAGQSRKADR
jgi:hypothetical protein